MALYISTELFDRINAHGESAYPEEGAGLLLGIANQADRHVFELLEFENAREEDARHNRYLLTAEDYLVGEQEAARLGLEVIGVFHSHPDHPDRPSEVDREWAMPWLSYVITSIQSGQAAASRSWQLAADRSRFEEELIQVTDRASN